MRNRPAEDAGQDEQMSRLVVGSALFALLWAGAATAAEDAPSAAAHDHGEAAAEAGLNGWDAARADAELALATSAGAQSDAVDAAAQRIKVAEHLEAIAMVEATIEAIERRASRYADELVRPLTLLGDALVGIGASEGAFGAYDRALHIARVNRGLHHPSQVAVVYRQARLLADGGDFAAANRRHEYAYAILLRSYGGDNPALLPGMFALADWYMAGYNIFSARALYEHAAAVAESNLAADHPALIRALRSVAATYRSERFPPFYTRRNVTSAATLGSYAGFRYRTTDRTSVNSFAKGERALIKVINIVQARDGADGSGRDSEPEGEELARAMLELGDWFLMFDKQARALSLYRRVWELLERNPSLLAQTFAAPSALYLPLPKPPKGRRSAPQPADGTAHNGVVELSVDINERGVVSRIDTIRSEPPDLMDFKVRRSVKQARYRPVFDGDTLQGADDVRVTHTFVYYPTDQPVPRSSNRVEAAPEGAAGADVVRTAWRQQ